MTTTANIIYQEYTIKVTHDEECIDISLSHNKTLAYYSAKFNSTSFQYKLPAVYKMVCDAFASESVLMTLDASGGVLGLQFSPLVGGFLAVQFAMYLPNRVLTPEERHSLYRAETEHKLRKLEEENAKLNERIKQLSISLESDSEYARIKNTIETGKVSVPVRMGYSFLSNQNTFLFLKINSKEVVIRALQAHKINLKNFKHLYRLQKVTMYVGAKVVDDLANDTLEELCIVDSPALKRVELVREQLPNLKSVRIHGCKKLNIENIEKFCADHTIQLILGPKTGGPVLIV